MGKRFSQTFQQRRYIDNKYMRKCSTSLVRQIKIKKHSLLQLHIYESGYHLKRQVSKDVDQLELSQIDGGNANGTTTLENRQIPEKVNPNSPLLGI